MTIVKHLEVKKTIVLEFTLPGVQCHSSTHSGAAEQQLSHTNHHEGWSLTVDHQNALETATVFEELARAIRESMV